jgi:hypothetical protein
MKYYLYDTITGAWWTHAGWSYQAGSPLSKNDAEKIAGYVRAEREPVLCRVHREPWSCFAGVDRFAVYYRERADTHTGPNVPDFYHRETWDEILEIRTWDDQPVDPDTYRMVERDFYLQH